MTFDTLMCSVSSVEESRMVKTLFNTNQLRCSLSNKRKLANCLLIDWQIHALLDLRCIFNKFYEM